MSRRAVPNQQADADRVETAADEAIAACGGNARDAAKALSNERTKQWNGFVVRRRSAEPRHPQEFVRSRADKQTVLLPRPPQVQELVGPLITMSRLRRKPATRY
jgi:hypothetical protein